MVPWFRNRSGTMGTDEWFHGSPLIGANHTGESFAGLKIQRRVFLRENAQSARNGITSITAMNRLACRRGESV